MLCARATRAITNHAPIGEYQLRFFPNEEFNCPCGLYPIEMRQHILYECKRFNEYWNPRRDSITHFTQFLDRNPNVFVFLSTIIQLGYFYSFLIFCSSFFFRFNFVLFFFFLCSIFFSFLPHVVSVDMYVVTKQLPQSAFALHVINCQF